MSRSGSVTLDKSPPLSVPVLAFGKVRVALEDLPCPFQFQNSATHPPMHGQTSCGVSTPGKGIRMNPTTQLNLDDIMLRKRSPWARDAAIHLCLREDRKEQNLARQTWRGAERGLPDGGNRSPQSGRRVLLGFPPQNAPPSRSISSVWHFLFFCFLSSFPSSLSMQQCWPVLDWLVALRQSHYLVIPTPLWALVSFSLILKNQLQRLGIPNIALYNPKVNIPVPHSML